MNLDHLAAVTPEDAELDAAFKHLTKALWVYRAAQDRFEKAVLVVAARNGGDVNAVLCAQAARLGETWTPDE